MTPQRLQLIITLTLAGLGMIGPFATDTYLPSFFEIEREFQVSEAMVQQTLSVYLFAFAAMTLIYGSLSDIFGRKPVILVGLTVFALSSLFAAFAPNFECLLLARVLQGFSAGAGIVIGQAIVRDLYGGSTAQQLMANIAMVFSLAPALAPVIGGYIADQYGWRMVFGFILAYAAVMVLFTGKFLPESLPKEKRQPVSIRNLYHQYIDTLKDKTFLCAAFSTGTSFGGQAIYIACASNIVIKILGMGPTDFAWLFIPMITGTVVGSWLSGQLAKYFATSKIVALGLTVMVIGGCMDVTFDHLFPEHPLPWVFLPLTIYILGTSIARPGMTILSLDLRPKTLGMASSLIAFIQTVVFALVAGALAPLLFGSMEKITYSTLAFALISVLFWVLSQTMRVHHHRKAERI